MVLLSCRNDCQRCLNANWRCQNIWLSGPLQLNLTNEAIAQFLTALVRENSIPYCTSATVCCKNDDGSNSGLKCSVEICEALDVKHMNLVNKQHAGYQLGNALVYVLVHDLVYLLPQLVYTSCDIQSH